MPYVFPDPRFAPGDIVALGADLHWRTLVDAYSKGIFPWPTEELPVLPWFCPLRRAVLFADEVHVSRSLRRDARRLDLRFTIDQAFEQVIEACATAPRGEQAGTWIFPEVQSAYVELHRRGYAHSVEAWLDDELVGGVYGVSVGGCFAGESMFHHVTGASKLALLHLVSYLEARGLGWIDVQVLTPHLELLGAREIPRGDFLDLLAAERAAEHILFG